MLEPSNYGIHWNSRNIPGYNVDNIKSPVAPPDCKSPRCPQSKPRIQVLLDLTPRYSQAFSNQFVNGTSFRENDDVTIKRDKALALRALKFEIYCAKSCPRTTCSQPGLKVEA